MKCATIVRFFVVVVVFNEAYAMIPYKNRLGQTALMRGHKLSFFNE